jgi:hypothetical protein
MVGMLPSRSLTSRAEGLGCAWTGSGRAAAEAWTAGTACAAFADGELVAALSVVDASRCAGVSAQPELSATKTMAAKKRITGTTPPASIDNRRC